MKYSEMNAHEKAAFRTVVDVMSYTIAAYELSLEDLPEDDPDYIATKAYLSKPHDELVEDIYKEVLKEGDARLKEHLRFAGGDFIRERISRRLNKWGY